MGDLRGDALRSEGRFPILLRIDVRCFQRIVCLLESYVITMIQLFQSLYFPPPKCSIRGHLKMPLNTPLWKVSKFMAMVFLTSQAGLLKLPNSH